MNEESANDEISLIDILAVLLNFRKLICILLVFAIALIAAGYFIYPSYQHENQKREGAEARMIIAPAPGAFYLLTNQTLGNYFFHPSVIKAVLEDVQQQSFLLDDALPWVPVKQSEQTGQFDRDYMSINERLTIKEDGRSGVLEISCKYENPESGILFLQSLYHHGSKALNNYLMPLAKSYAEDYERIIKGPDFVFSERQNNSGSEYFIMINALLTGKTNTVIQLFEPYAVVVGKEIPLGEFQKKYRMTALILFFGALFFSIFLVFLLNAIQNVKNDQEAMKKIRNALVKNTEKKNGY